jgi:hypothetical protein
VTYTLPDTTAAAVLAAVDALTARGRIVARPTIAEESGVSERTVRRAVGVLIGRGELEEYRHGHLRRPVAAKSAESRNLAATLPDLARVCDALNGPAVLQRVALAAGRAHPLGLRRTK